MLKVRYYCRLCCVRDAFRVRSFVSIEQSHGRNVHANAKATAVTENRQRHDSYKKLFEVTRWRTRTRRELVLGQIISRRPRPLFWSGPCVAYGTTSTTRQTYQKNVVDLLKRIINTIRERFPDTRGTGRKIRIFHALDQRTTKRHDAMTDVSSWTRRVVNHIQVRNALRFGIPAAAVFSSAGGRMVGTVRDQNIFIRF